MARLLFSQQAILCDAEKPRANKSTEEEKADQQPENHQSDQFLMRIWPGSGVENIRMITPVERAINR
jgi:hypothetical protein